MTTDRIPPPSEKDMNQHLEMWYDSATGAPAHVVQAAIRRVSHAERERDELRGKVAELEAKLADQARQEAGDWCEW